MQLIEYEDIAELLHLDITDKDFDELCLKAAWQEVEKLIGYCISQKEYSEILTVRDNRVILDCIYIDEIETITDLTGKNEIETFTVDYENKAVYFVPVKADRNAVLVNYTAGYTKETLTADIKECVIKLFLYKQKTMRKMMNNEDISTDEKLLYETKTILNRYSRKSL